MKKIFGTALLLAVLAVMAFGSIALADDGVHTDWNFNGPGEINIDTWKFGSVYGEDHFHVDSYAGGSWGWQDVSTTTLYIPLLPPTTDFTIDRHAEVYGGTISTFTVRDVTYPIAQAHTEYGAYVQTGGPGGYGVLDQHHYSNFAIGNMHTQLYADCLYTVGAWVEGWDGGYFNFALGAQGYGSAFLDLNTTDRSELFIGPVPLGMRQLWGSFFLAADPADAGFHAAWGNVADFGGTVITPSIIQDFNVNVGYVLSKDPNPIDGGWLWPLVTASAPGWYNEGASADWVIIYGFIHGMK